MSDVNFYFEYRNTNRLQLPVNPEKLDIQLQGKNSTVDVVNLGDVNVLKAPGLQTISFESFIPVANTGSYVQPGAQIYAPEFYQDFFKAVMRQKEPVTFVVTGLSVSLQMAVESFEYYWKESDPDMYYKVSLKEYRKHSIKIAAASSTGNTAATTSSPRANTSKKVAIGSTVRVNGRLYKTSYKENGGVTEKNAIRKVNFIKVGRPCPYHVTTLQGGWRGWVTADSVEVID